MALSHRILHTVFLHAISASLTHRLTPPPPPKTQTFRHTRTDLKKCTDQCNKTQGNAENVNVAAIRGLSIFLVFHCTGEYMSLDLIHFVNLSGSCSLIPQKLDLTHYVSLTGSCSLIPQKLDLIHYVSLISSYSLIP